MKTLIAIIISCAAVCCAQDTPAEQGSSTTMNVKRLQSVTWDLSTHKLVWTVENGSVVDGEFMPQTKVKYEVSPDDAYMALAEEKRPFGEDEADALHHLLDVLSLYCVESTVWWDHGAADTETPATTAPSFVTKPEAPAGKKPVIQPDGKTVKVGQQRTAPPASDKALLAAVGR